MTQFSNRKISASCINLINKIVRELENQGKKIIKLSIGELDTLRPIEITEISKNEFDYSNRYSNIYGDSELRKLIANKIKLERNVSYDSEKEIIITNGARGGAFYVFNSILNEGDEVILPRGTWVTYFNLLQNFNCKAVVADTKKENNYKLTPEILEKCITSKTKAIVITNPGNPTGAIFSKDELSALLNVIKKHKEIFFIADEIYSEIKYISGQVCSLVQATNDEELRKRIVVFNGFSKCFAMAGDRIAYVLSHNRELVDKIFACQALVGANPSNIPQIIAKKIMKKDLTSYYDKLLTRLKKNRDYIYDFVNNNIEGLKAERPDGALYTMIDYSELKKKFNKNPIFENDVNLCKYFLDNGVAVTPGSAFAIDDSFRVSFACSLEDVKSGLDIIKKSLNSVK